MFMKPTLMKIICSSTIEARHRESSFGLKDKIVFYSDKIILHLFYIYCKDEKSINAMSAWDERKDHFVNKIEVTLCS